MKIEYPGALREIGLKNLQESIGFPGGQIRSLRVKALIPLFMGITFVSLVVIF